MKRAWPPSSSFATCGTSARPFSTPSDLLELNGTDLRKEAIEVRKATLASVLRKARQDVWLNEHLEQPEAAVVFQHACKMGLERVVSKRLGSRYRSGPPHIERSATLHGRCRSETPCDTGMAKKRGQSENASVANLGARSVKPASK
jgi:hypothetical protein